MIRRFPHTLRRGGRGGSRGGGALTLPSGAFVSLRDDGFTTVSSEIATMDGEGSQAVRMSPGAVNRGAEVTVGDLTGAQLDNTNSEYYVSDTTIDPTLGMFATILIRQDATASLLRVLDVGPTRIRTASGGRFTMEHGSSDIVSTDSVAIGEVACLSCYWAPAGGTSRFWIDAVSQGTTAGDNGLEPGAVTLGIGARASDGAVAWSGTFLELHIWSDVDDLGAFSVDDVHAYMSQQAVAAGGTAFAGSQYVTHMWGQSNRVSTADSADFTNVEGVDYTAEFPAIQLARQGTTFANLDDSADTTGTGSEVSLGRALANANVNQPHIIKYGQGGTNLHTQWADGGSVWNAAVAQANTLLGSLPDPVIQFTSWWQGESDADVEADANAYQANLVDLKARYKAEFGPYLAPNWRFIVVQKSTAQTRPFIATVRAAEIAFADGDAEVLRIDTENLLFPGGHTDAEGQVGVGFAELRAFQQDANQVAYPGDVAP